MERKMLLWLTLLGSVISAPTDEFKEFSYDFEDSPLKYDNGRSNIVPGRLAMSDGSSNIKPIKPDTWKEVLELDPDNSYMKELNTYIEQGWTSKGLTFCIYDENLRNAAIALFRAFQTTEDEAFERLKDWAKNNVNREMYMYALRLDSVFGDKTNASTLYAPFVWNPNYFVNSEAITKALLAANDVLYNGKIDSDVSKVDQYKYNYSYEVEEATKYVVVNANYSGWNIPNNDGDKLGYFREDVALNSYYLGLHLLSPFWMSNDELDSYNPRYAEHFYYAHKRLSARYHLEILHLNDSRIVMRTRDLEYMPYLNYKNGLPFPTARNHHRIWNEEQAYLKTIDITIRECIARGLIIMPNGTLISLTDDSHINILAKLIRANLDNSKVANIARSIIGYGGYLFPKDTYNPAPSVLHHPETALRNPNYWHMIQFMLHYFTEFTYTMEPYDLSQHEFKDILIVDNEFTKFKTYFDNYKFSVDFALSNNGKEIKDRPVYMSVRQRRLRRVELTLKFKVKSAEKRESIVRLYLGPNCDINASDNYNKFFELDTFNFTLEKGMNDVIWRSEASKSLSFDWEFDTSLSRSDFKYFNMFKFPSSLLIPHGRVEGLNLTLFVIITPADEQPISSPPTFYNEMTKEFDSKPLGFPFHRKVNYFKNTASNYRFYNVTIYHNVIRYSADYSDYFSPEIK